MSSNRTVREPGIPEVALFALKRRLVLAFNRSGRASLTVPSGVQVLLPILVLYSHRPASGFSAAASATIAMPAKVLNVLVSVFVSRKVVELPNSDNTVRLVIVDGGAPWVWACSIDS